MDQDFVETETGADMVPIRVSLQHAGMLRRERGNETGEVPSTCTRIQHRNIAAAFNEVALDVLAMMGSRIMVTACGNRRTSNHPRSGRSSTLATMSSRLTPYLAGRAQRQRFAFPIVSKVHQVHYLCGTHSRSGQRVTALVVVHHGSPVTVVSSSSRPTRLASSSSSSLRKSGCGGGRARSAGSSRNDHGKVWTSLSSPR